MIFSALAPSSPHSAADCRPQQTWHSIFSSHGDECHLIDKHLFSFWCLCLPVSLLHIIFFFNRTPLTPHHAALVSHTALLHESKSALVLGTVSHLHRYRQQGRHWVRVALYSTSKTACDAAEYWKGTAWFPVKTDGPRPAWNMLSARKQNWLH